MANNEEISVVKATPEHSDQVLRLLEESFVPREPLCMAVDSVWEDFLPGFLHMKEVVNEGHSFVALNPASRVVGCRISTLLKIPRNVEPEPNLIDIAGDSEKLTILMSVFRSFLAGWTKELPDCHVALEFILMCVEEQYGGKGIAGELVKKSLALAEELKVDYVYTVATNWKSQKVFEKLKFTTIRMKNYDEFVDEDGKPLLKMKDGSTCVKWMVKKIKM